MTASLDLAEDYRGVLLGVARTLSFTDPDEPAEAPASPDCSQLRIRLRRKESFRVNTGKGEERAVSESSQAPYATDGTDFRGALRHHYIFALKRFAKRGPIFLAVWLLAFYSEIDYLFLPGLVGFFGFIVTVIFLWSRVLWILKCSRVFHTYPLEFRGPVTNVRKDGELLSFRFHGQGQEATMRAKDPLGRRRWPEGISDGVWFAGDDPFGGAAIVPGSGELLFMQPNAWRLFAGERKNAGPERIRRSWRAWIRWRVSFRLRVYGT
ncbi:hypothetical protein [Streptomyces sp. KR80]|uniref:hypothetical protein n=1 Tax=Streptomyces sp. KR80 TaxID=3457426 RepID=UPI003FD0E214